jgi:hypothetical protein
VRRCGDVLESTGAEAHLRCHVVPALDLQEFLTESAAAAREGFMRGGIPRSLRGALGCELSRRSTATTSS